MYLRNETVPPVDSKDWYRHYATMDVELRCLDSRGVILDSFAGSTDDAKLTAAMDYCKALPGFPPPILLGAREYTFSSQRTVYDGFALIGAEGMSNAEKGSTHCSRTRVTLSSVGGVWLSCSGGKKSNTENWCMTFKNIGFRGGSGPGSIQWMGGSARVYNMLIRDTTFSNIKSTLGSQATALKMSNCLIDGWFETNNQYNGAMHITGDDNVLFTGTSNIDSAPGFTPAGAAQYHVWLDNCNRNIIGPAYFTAHGKWGAILQTGPSRDSLGSQGGPNWVQGAKIEGRNTKDACDGSLVRVEGGIMHLRDNWLGYAMLNPSNMGHNPQDNGVVHQTAGQVIIDGATADRANGIAADAFYFLYSSGGEAIIQNVNRSSLGGTWGSARPRVTGAGILIYDATVQKV